MNQPKPLLSLCLPTFNRAALLKQALTSLAPQIINAGPRVELIICDNCSPDATKDVVEGFKYLMPLRYYRHDRNLGFANNILTLTNDLASGEFAWIVCDDDLMHPEGLSRVIDVLEQRPEIDYMFVNTTPRPVRDRQRLMNLVATATVPLDFPNKCREKVSREIPNFESFIDHSFDDALLGSVMCHVFRLSRWRTFKLTLPTPSNDIFDLAMIYPHCIILANTMRNAQCFYLAKPCIFTFWGEQEWIGMVPYIITVHFQDLLDYYEKCGISHKQIEKCRRKLLLNSAPALRSLLFNRQTLGNERFSLKHFFSRNIQHPIALLMLPLLMAAHSSVQGLRMIAKSMLRR
jgi:glycosyltransferase involved in cell wall biosynthesis